LQIEAGAVVFDIEQKRVVLPSQQDPKCACTLSIEPVPREEASAVYLPFHFIAVDDGRSGAMTDVATAEIAIEEEQKSRGEGGARLNVTITKGIQEAVVAALHARHPRHFGKPGVSIIAHTIVDSRTRHAPVPEFEGSTGASLPAARDDDEVVQRAAERLAKLRGEF
jgi:hypothetical protein